MNLLFDTNLPCVRSSQRFYFVCLIFQCYKRRNEDDDTENYENVDSSLIQSFKSAKEQLAIENAKKGQPAPQQYQQQQQQQQQQQIQPSLAKRPMTNLPAR